MTYTHESQHPASTPEDGKALIYLDFEVTGEISPSQTQSVAGFRFEKGGGELFAHARR